MKKKFAALACALVLAMSLPMMAFGAQFNSPSGTTVSNPDGTGLTVSGDVSGDGYIEVQNVLPNGVVAKGAEGKNVLVSFEVTAHGNITFTGLDLTFSLGAKYAGATATVYIEHGDGTTETQTVTVAADGTITLHVTKLSVFSVVIDESTIGQGAASGVDTGATSPQTGVSLVGVAGASAVMFVGAGVVAVALRKKLAE